MSLRGGTKKQPRSLQIEEVEDEVAIPTAVGTRNDIFEERVK